jgi:hypothetical protein
VLAAASDDEYRHKMANYGAFVVTRVSPEKTNQALDWTQFRKQRLIANYCCQTRKHCALPSTQRSLEPFSTHRRRGIA